MVATYTDHDIALLREAGMLVSHTLAEVAKHLTPGISTQDLDAIAFAFVKDHGAEPAFKGYRVPGIPTPFPGTLCTSINDVVVHGIPNSITINEGDLVSVDCGVKLNGFFGDSAFTFIVGDAAADDVALCERTYHSLYLGINQARKGNRIGDIGNAVQTYAEQSGYGVVHQLVGHGIGRKLHMEPSVPNVGRKGRGTKLSVGMTMCLEPMINAGTASVTTDDDGWTIRTADGRPSAHYEHMIAVRAGQAEILTSFEPIQAVHPLPFNTTIALPHG